MHDLRISIAFLRILMVITLFPWSINCTQAQLSDTTRHLVEEGWIEIMNNNISAKLSLNNFYETFKIITETNDIILYPNFKTICHLGVNYRFISLNIGLAPSFIPGNGDDDLKGKSKTFNFGTSLIFRHWFHNVSYARVKGYYRKNTRDYQEWEPGDPYIQFPDLLFNRFSYTLGWKSNPKVSLPSLTTQTERQLKSAGSFMPVLNLRYYVMDDQSTLDPGDFSQKSNNLEYSIGVGYIYTFVIKEKFYTSLAFTPGIGFTHTKLITRYSSGNEVNWQNNFAYLWEGEAGLGYNGRDFFTGFYIGLSGITYKQEKSTVRDYESRIFFQGFIGLRLKAPDGLKNFMDRIENKIKRGHKKSKI